METTYDVKVYKILTYKGARKTTYTVRWVVAGKRWREPFEGDTRRPGHRIGRCHPCRRRDRRGTAGLAAHRDQARGRLRGCGKGGRGRKGEYRTQGDGSPDAAMVHGAIPGAREFRRGCA